MENIPGDGHHLKVTPVIKIQNEELYTPVSSGAEDDDDVQGFFEMLAEDPSWRPPSEETTEKIVNLLDFYFSNENLLKDKFLLKHVKRNRLGYVSVKLLTSFKKIKSLSKSDWKLTAFCISKSKKLQLNKSGTKVRRLELLPDIDIPTTSIKTILFKPEENNEQLSLDDLSTRFKQFGRLTTVRIVDPCKEVPLDLRNHVIKHPELGVNMCVVVEYHNTSDAQTAFKNLSKEARCNGKSETFSLLGSGRNPKKQKGIFRNVYDSADDSSSQLSSRETSPMMPRKNRLSAQNSPKNSPKLKHKNRDLSPDPDKDKNWRGEHRRSCSNQSSPSGSPWFKRKNFKDQSNLSPNDNLKNFSRPKHPSPLATGGRTSPWLERRRQLQAKSQGNSPVSTPGSSPLMGRKFNDGVPVGVVRLPRGPPTATNNKGFDLHARKKIPENKTTSGLKGQGAISQNCGDGIAATLK